MSSNRGVGIIEALIAIAIFSFAFIALFEVLNIGMTTLTSNKAKINAIMIGRDRMEYIRSLDYSNVGIVGGDPVGVLEQHITKHFNNRDFVVDTFVYWFDNQLDGGGDLNTNDYKKVEVDVSWIGKNPQADVIKLYTTVSDDHIE